MIPFWPPPADLTPRQEWALVAVGWAWLVTEVLAAAGVLCWLGAPQ